jgi:hypothetical protein
MEQPACGLRQLWLFLVISAGLIPSPAALRKSIRQPIEIHGAKFHAFHSNELTLRIDPSIFRHLHEN